MWPGLDPSILASLAALATEATRWVTVAALAMGRPVGLMLIMPVFTRAELGTTLRLSFAFGLSLPMFAPLALSLGSADIPAARLTLMGLKELFVGFLIGYLLGAPFWAVQSVGELIDSQRGISSPAGPSDPSSKSQSSATHLLLGMVALVVFVAADGLNIVVEILYGSYALWPVGHALPGADADTLMEVGRLVDRVMRVAVIVSGPVVVLLLLLDLCVALLGRLAPQLRLNDLAPALKNAVVVVFLLLYASSLLHYLGFEVASAREMADQLGHILR